MQAYVSLRQNEGPGQEFREADPQAAPLEGRSFLPRPPASIAQPWGPPAPASAALPLDDHGVVLHPVDAQRTGDPSGTLRNGAGPGGLRGGMAAVHRYAVRSGPAKAVGTVALLAAVIGTTTLTGALVGVGGTAQRVAPEATSSAASVTEPDTPPDPVGRPSRAPDDETATGIGGGPSAVNSPSRQPPRPTPLPTSSRAATPSPDTTPEPASPGRRADVCDAPRLPGAPCPTSGEPPASPPPRQPDGLCCGATGLDVTELQLRLRWIDFYQGTADGIYDQQLTDSVAAYQRSRGVTSDLPGQYGPVTRTVLQREVPDVVSD